MNLYLLKKKISYNLTPEIVYEKLKNISDDECRILGLQPERTRPEYMIHKTFLIPPIAIRPSARGDFGGGAIMEDGLTHRCRTYSRLPRCVFCIYRINLLQP